MARRAVLDWSMLRVRPWLRAKVGPAIQAPIWIARSQRSTPYGGAAPPRPELDPDKLGDVVLSIGAAGLYVPSARARFLAAIPQFAETITLSDGYAALIGAGGGNPCGLIAVGTGVAGHRLWPNGWSARRDAWGWIGGDRGSGAWLGRKALRHTLMVIDGIRAARWPE